MKWLYLTYALYWSAVLSAVLFTLAGHPLIPPEEFKKAINETAQTPYEQRLAQTAAEFALVAALSYPALIYASVAYGVVTAAAAEAMGLGYAMISAAVYHLVLLIMEEAARWHPVAQKLAKRGKIDLRRYLLWTALLLSLAGVLSL